MVICKCFATACHGLLAYALSLGKKKAINIFKSSQIREPIPDNLEPIQRTYPHGYVPLEASYSKFWISQDLIRDTKLLVVTYEKEFIIEIWQAILRAG